MSEDEENIKICLNVTGTITQGGGDVAIDIVPRHDSGFFLGMIFV